ncbi:putative receptor-like protein kinase [Tanacetum coccineum]
MMVLIDPTKRGFLDWEKRYKIIKGVANGLLYLHEDSCLMIIHCDMKASNVLLDGEMNAKIADFGLAGLFKQHESQADTSRIVGTHFGVLVIEIAAGQRNIGFQNGESIQNLLSFALDIEDNFDSSFARMRLCILTKQPESILEKFKVIFKGKVFVARAKELFTWNPSFLEPKKSVYTSDDTNQSMALKFLMMGRRIVMSSQMMNVM